MPDVIGGISPDASTVALAIRANRVLSPLGQRVVPREHRKIGWSSIVLVRTSDGSAVRVFETELALREYLFFAVRDIAARKAQDRASASRAQFVLTRNDNGWRLGFVQGGTSDEREAVARRIAGDNASRIVRGLNKWWSGDGGSVMYV